MIHDTQNAQISQKQDWRNVYVIMKTMCPPGYHHNGFLATHVIGHSQSFKEVNLGDIRTLVVKVKSLKSKTRFFVRQLLCIQVILIVL